MEMFEKVSIVVPVYNVKKYLNSCLDSIVNQTYKNIEIILVDNGSTDGSELICEEYAKKYDFIKFENQNRRGPSAARNKGIDVANGEYIQFVDSDDVLEQNMTKKLVESMNDKVNLVLCGINTKIIGENKTEIYEYKPSINGRIKIREFNKYFGDLYKSNLINSPCNKLYVTELIDKYNIRFIEDVDMGEDLLFNLEYLKKCNDIFLINEGLYNYLKYKNNYESLTRNFKHNFFENQQLLFKRIREYLSMYNSYDENKDIIESAYTNSIISCFENLFHKNSKYDSISVKEEITSIITDDIVIENIEYFYNKGTPQKRLIGYFITRKNSKLIYVTIKFKIFIRNKLGLVFKLLKNVNNSGK